MSPVRPAACQRQESVVGATERRAPRLATPAGAVSTGCSPRARTPARWRTFVSGSDRPPARVVRCASSMSCSPASTAQARPARSSSEGDSAVWSVKLMTRLQRAGWQLRSACAANLRSRMRSPRSGNPPGSRLRTTPRRTPGVTGFRQPAVNQTRRWVGVITDAGNHRARMRGGR